MNRIIKNITFLFLLLLTVGAVRAQVDDKGVTSTGKEVDCSTINPSVDQTVNQYGAIVTRPTLTRNGKLITRDCYCPFNLGDDNASITDHVYCTSVKMFAEITYRDPNVREQPQNAHVYVFTDAGYTHCVDTVEPAILEHLDGTDTLTVDITGLSCYTRYYFRLVATNTTGCVFDWTDSTRDVTVEKPTTCTVAAARALSDGSDLSHEHLAEGTTDQIDSVYDHEGNRYAVVQIGEQCWLKENMRATTSPSTGSRILMNAKISFSSKSAFWHQNDSTTYSKYGVMYNWCAAVDTFLSDGNPSHTELANATGHSSDKLWTCVLPAGNRRGVCPKGWHLPTDNEWTALTTSAGVGVESGGTGLGKLAGGCDWPENTTVATCPGNYTYAERNSTGFSALPEGSYNVEGNFDNVGSFAYFWSATPHDVDNAGAAYGRYLDPGWGYMLRNANVKANGYSVRCVRDNFNPSVTLCGDCEEGSIFIKAVANVDSCALLSSTKSFVASKKKPAVDDKFAGLDPGKYYVVSISSTSNTVTDSVTLTGKVHVPCVGTARVGTEISAGVYANKEWGSAADIIDSVSDMQGNVYEVVQIGNQCWLKENMRCTTSPNGLLTQSTTSTSTAAYRNAYYYVPANNITLSGVEYTPEQFTRKYGIFYNFLAAVDTNVYAFTNDIYTHPRRGICPKGWHIPSETDWLVLEKEVLDGVSGLREDSLGNNIRGTGGGRLTTSCDWVVSLSSTNPGNYLYAERNSTNFSALPSGMFSNPGTGESAVFWTANQNAVNSGNAWVRRLMYGTKGSVRNSLVRAEGASVRCVRDVPQVSAVVDSVTCTSMMVTAEVTGLDAITGKTVCAYKNADFTGTPVCAGVSDMRVSNDSIYATLKNLNCNTRYYVKVTATDGTNSLEGSISDSTRDMSFENLTTCTVGSVRALGIGSDLSHEHLAEGTTDQIDSVYDHEGNRYAVVQIGEQCWLKENMRATTSPSTGSRILMNKVLSFSSKSACWHHNDSTTYSKYGVLYNWCAAVDTFYNDGNPSHTELANAEGHESYKLWSCELPAGNRRGVCPKGWHLPTDAEWTTLTTNAGVGVENGGTGAGKLAGGCDWLESTTVASCPGNYSYAERNSTGFSALPEGSYNVGGNFDNVGSFAYFWSATPHDVDNAGAAYGRYLDPGWGYMLRNANVKANGYSVRCVRNAPDTITFMSHDGTGATKKQVVNTGEQTQLEANTFSRDNFIFTGWSTDPSGCANTQYADGDSITTHGNVTLYAQWDISFCTGNPIGNESGNDRIDSVKDHEGNWYKVVQIGDQCWLKENMRATTSPKGYLTNGVGKTISKYIAYYYNYTDATQFTLRERGILYNWAGALDTTGTADISESFSNRRGICPEGWHVPSHDDWWIMEQNTLTDLVPDDYSKIEQYRGKGSGNWSAGCKWITSGSFSGSEPGNYLYPDRNYTGFSVLPAGYYSSSGSFELAGSRAYIWSSTTHAADITLAYLRGLNPEKEGMNFVNNSKAFGRSVRCVRNTPTSATISFHANGGTGSMNEMSVTTMTATTLNANAFTHEGNFEFAGWSTDQCNSEVAYTDGASITPTESITLYAQWNSYCDASSILAQSGSDLSHEHAYKGTADKIDSVYDHEGNRYAVVQIGNQCWLKENMRCTTSPRQGTSAGQVNLRLGNTNSVLSYTDPYYYDHNAAATQYAIEERGYLYNWAAAMDTSFTSQSQIPASGDFPNHRGICPQGWHVPTHTEWIAMEKIYMMESDGTPIKETTLTAPNSRPNYYPDSRGKGAGKYTASCGWIADDGATAPGNYACANRNISGFSALPIGCFGQEEGPIKFYYLGESSDMWTATPVSQTGAWSRFFLNNNEGVYHNELPGNKNYGFAVRCLRNN